eukprot:354248-Chlamydomonas_euryale.AAC.6
MPCAEKRLSPAAKRSVHQPNAQAACQDSIHLAVQRTCSLRRPGKSKALTKQAEAAGYRRHTVRQRRAAARRRSRAASGCPADVAAPAGTYAAATSGGAPRARATVHVVALLAVCPLLGGAGGGGVQQPRRPLARTCPLAAKTAAAPVARTPGLQAQTLCVGAQRGALLEGGGRERVKAAAHTNMCGAGKGSADMLKARTLHGGCAEVEWTLRGCCVEVIWTLHGGYMQLAWTLHGRCMEVASGETSSGRAQH